MAFDDDFVLFVCDVELHVGYDVCFIVGSLSLDDFGCTCRGTILN